MKKLLFKSYHFLFFKIYYKGYIPFLSRQKSRQYIESPILILWLKYSTEYVIEQWLEDFYTRYITYDKKDTQGMLQFPGKLREMTLYSYLCRHIWMGYHPTLKNSPITLERLLKLNPNKKDKQYTQFLQQYLIHYWENPDKRITKNKLDKIYPI